MTPAAPPTLRARPSVRRTVGRHGGEIIDAHVFTPFPHIPREVVNPELVRLFQPDRMRRVRPTRPTETGEPPADSPTEKMAEQAPGGTKNRTDPADGIGIITSAEGESVAPVRAATGGVFPLSLCGKAKAEFLVGARERLTNRARVQQVDEAAPRVELVPTDILDGCQQVRAPAGISVGARLHRLATSRSFAPSDASKRQRPREKAATVGPAAARTFALRPVHLKIS